MQLNQQTKETSPTTKEIEEIKDPNYFDLSPVRSSAAQRSRRGHRRQQSDDDEDYIIDDEVAVNEFQSVSAQPVSNDILEKRQANQEQSNSVQMQKDQLQPQPRRARYQRRVQDVQMEHRESSISADGSLSSILDAGMDKKEFKLFRDLMIEKYTIKLVGLNQSVFEEELNQTTSLRKLTLDKLTKAVNNRRNYIEKPQHSSKSKSKVSKEADILLNAKTAFIQMTDSNSFHNLTTESVQPLALRTQKIFNRYASDVDEWDSKFMQTIFQILEFDQEKQHALLQDLIQLNKQDTADAYVRNFISLPLPRDADQVMAVSSNHKIDAWLRANHHIERIQTQILAVGVEFSRLVANCQKSRFKYEIEDNNLLLGAVIDSCPHNQKFTFSPQLVLLIKQRKQFRMLLKDWIKMFYNKSKEDVGFEIPVGLCKFIPSLQNVFMNDFNFSMVETDLILSHPDKLFWDDLITLLSTAQEKTKLIQLIMMLNEGTLNPTEDVKQCLKGLNKHPWLFDFLLKDEKCKEMQFEGVIRMLNQIEPLTAAQAYLALQKYGANQLVSETREASLTRTFAVVDNNDLTAEAAGLASNSFNCVAEYQKMMQIATEFKQVAKSSYTIIAGLLLYSARAVSSIKPVVYAQLDQGNGKSFGNIQICQYLIKYQNVTPVYVTISKELIKDVENKLKKLQVKGVQVIHYEDLVTHVNKGKVILFDEYYSALIQSKVKFDSARKICSMFQLGTAKQRLIISTGHKSDQFNQFLTRYYGDDVEFQINNSMLDLQGMTPQYNLRIKACSSINEANDSAIKLIQTISTEYPIICFGVTWPETQRFGLSDKFIVRQLKKDGNDLEDTQLEISNQTRGIIGLPAEFNVGVDIRFQADAVVVIVTSEQPEPDDVKQMVARGNRSMGNYNGHMYYVGEKSRQEAYQKRLIECRGRDFKDGADVVLAFKKYPYKLPKGENCQRIVSELGGQWMLNVNDVTSVMTATEKEAFDSALTDVRTQRGKAPKQDRKRKASERS